MVLAYRVLVVEDEAYVQLDIKHELRAQGITIVGPANSPEAALALIEREKIDAAIPDIKLGNENSMTVADALAERGICFMFLTGHSEAVLPPRHKERPFFTKPFPLPLLARKMKSLLG